MPILKQLDGEKFLVRVVSYLGDEYMKLLGEGYEIVDRFDSQGKNERTMRKPKPGPLSRRRS